MPGLLSGAAPGFTRLCRYDHGPLRPIDGVWLFSPARTPQQAPEGLLGLIRHMQYAVQVHVCDVCGYVELSDYPPKAP